MIIDLKKINSLWIGGINKNRELKIKSLLDKLEYNHKQIPAVISNGFNGNTQSTKNAIEESIKYNEPVIIFEDDANITEHYNNEIDVPEDADAVWLGTSIYGLVNNWESMSLRDGIYLTQPKKTGEYNNFYKVENMLSLHAVVFITNKYKQSMLNYLQYLINKQTAPDIITAETMKYFNIYACKKPMFFQDDNAHNSSPTLTALDSIF
jgi:GR25 family glycosyltransferase involved in LPS biosynthesis